MLTLSLLTVALACHDTHVHAHVHSHAHAPSHSHSSVQSSTNPPATQATPPSSTPALPWQADSFTPFQPHITVRADGTWLWVESDGLPHAPSEYAQMVGIVSWQQQVPLPQPYTGTNAWQIPLKPTLAEHPVDGKRYLRRGAIALAANGIPIFNALNNRGEDTLLAGELDEYGGHCGRGDDYHYHAAPLFLQKVVGKDKPIAFALDGFAIYGLFNPRAKAGSDEACPLGSTEPLDSLGGHFCTVPEGEGIDGGTRSYHYHASKKYPYINGGMRGTVRVENDGIEPQPRAEPIRPALPPLKGAKITGFKQTGPKAWTLTLTLNGKSARVEYAANTSGGWDFTFVGTDGSVRKESYSAKRAGGDQSPPRGERGQRGGGNRPPPPPPR